MLASKAGNLTATATFLAKTGSVSASATASTVEFTAFSPPPTVFPDPFPGTVSQPNPPSPAGGFPSADPGVSPATSAPGMPVDQKPPSPIESAAERQGPKGAQMGQAGGQDVNGLGLNGSSGGRIVSAVSPKHGPPLPQNNPTRNPSIPDASRIAAPAAGPDPAPNGNNGGFSGEHSASNSAPHPPSSSIVITSALVACLIVAVVIAAVVRRKRLPRNANRQSRRKVQLRYTPSNEYLADSERDDCSSRIEVYTYEEGRHAVILSAPVEPHKLPILSLLSGSVPPEGRLNELSEFSDGGGKRQSFELAGESGPPVSPASLGFGKRRVTITPTVLDNCSEYPDVQCKSPPMAIIVNKIPIGVVEVSNSPVEFMDGAVAYLTDSGFGSGNASLERDK